MTTKTPRAKPTLTAQQIQNQAALLQDMQAPVDQAVGDVPVIAANFRIMRGLGEDVVIAGKTYNLAPYILAKKDEGHALIRKCHALLVAEAMLPDPEKITVGDVTQVYNAVVGRTDPGGNRIAGAEPPFTPEQVTLFYRSLYAGLDEEQMNALYQPVLLAIRRHHPDVTQADLEPDFDLSTFVRCLRIILKQDSALAESF